MFTSNERGIRKQAQVDFTRSGWRQFFKLNRSLGARFIRGFVLRYELAAYLTAHEAAGAELDEGCREVCYEDGVYLLLKMIIGGEVTSKAAVDCGRIVADAIDRIGYTMCDLCEDSHDPLELEIRIHDQSPDISAAVGAANLGAGDQGIVVGYATNETDEYLPLPVVLAHRICKRLDELKPQTPWLGADGKAQVTVAYENNMSVAVTAVVVSLQHDAEMDRKGIRRFVGKEVLGKVLPRELLKEDTSILIHLPAAELQQHDQSHGF